MVNPAPSRTRCALVWLGTSLALVALVAWLAPDLAAARAAVAAGDLAGQTFERLLAWLFAVVALLGAGWLWLVTALVTLEAARGTAGRTPGVPRAVRRLVLVACGAALGGVVAAPAQATPGDLHLDRSGSPALAAVSGLPLPDRPSDASPAVARLERRLTGRPTPAADGGFVDVRPGDTLWGLAVARLGPGAPDDAVQREWRRIYALNRAVVGPDPDLVHPGQRLRLPRA